MNILAKNRKKLFPYNSSPRPEICPKSASISRITDALPPRKALLPAPWVARKTLRRKAKRGMAAACGGGYKKIPSKVHVFVSKVHVFV